MIVVEDDLMVDYGCNKFNLAMILEGLPHADPDNLSTTIAGYYANEIPACLLVGNLYNYNSYRMSTVQNDTFSGASGSPAYTHCGSFDDVIGIIQSGGNININGSSMPAKMGMVISRPLLEFYFHPYV